MKLKIPNILTIGRIILVPIFIGTFFLPGPMGDLIPFFIFVLASFTDFLDGLLARLYKEESKLGELLDPIADKIIVASALILLVMNDTIKEYEIIAAIIIMIREILIKLAAPLTLMTLFLLCSLMPLFLMAGLIRQTLESPKSVAPKASLHH